ncbi:MAG: hypothetical protein IJY27_00010 [Clostridia bacterium]|nr:hypothetical protein [Clostridia bacterium]
MKKEWTINSGEAVHTVKYRRNIFGVAHVEIDGDEFPLGHVSAFRERREPFRVGESQCILSMKGTHADIISNDCEVALV